jgi:hypothetical protein
MIRIKFLHLHEVSRKMILPTDLLDSWKLAYLLVGLHFAEEISGYRKIMPRDIPGL